MVKASFSSPYDPQVSRVVSLRWGFFWMRVSTHKSRDDWADWGIINYWVYHIIPIHLGGSIVMGVHQLDGFC